MNSTIRKLLSGHSDNHILPFFWQHGEDEATLRKYMQVIDEANCKAVCVESRSHPDFCGPKWWTDLDVIMDEARNRGMKVWILDDSHFPTGYANGAVEQASDDLCRQSICANRVELGYEPKEVTLNLGGMIPPPFTPSLIEQYVLPRMPKPRHFDDDTILHVSAFCTDTQASIDLSGYVDNGVLTWTKPKGNWRVWVCGLSRNCGPHRNYINMLKMPSVRLLLDAVYEPHYARYKDDFGKTLAGFFSDEPELGNGHLYDQGNVLGTNQDLPFSDEMPKELEKRLGENWSSMMYLLWENEAGDKEKARVRYAYMDAVTTLVKKDFSYQVGDWCRAHGVEYIGHMVEDAGTHARTAAGLGHYFRGLAGQDMAGIDDIGGQVYPQGEDDDSLDRLGRKRDNEFFHFLLGRLASSAAAIEPLKKGRAMCEIFGNYGWGEGVKLEKYLADHFMVRGVNYYVPHAFSPKAFPDPDCPPHFYAHGHNPQYRYFGALMAYMNRVCTLNSSVQRGVEVGVLYHAEAEWTGRCMLSEKPARVLEEHQIGFDILPVDVFSETEHYHTRFGNPLKVNTQSYKALVVPASQYITAEFAQAAAKLHADGLPVIFIDALPEGICNGDDALLEPLRKCPVIQLTQLVEHLDQLGIGEVKASPSSRYLRVLHGVGETEHYFFVNEANDTYRGVIRVPNKGPCYAYNAWDNRLEALTYEISEDGTSVHVVLEPLKSLIIVFDKAENVSVVNPLPHEGREIEIAGWSRAVCEGSEYPSFSEPKAVTLPDNVALEMPEFSGFVRYTAQFEVESPEGLCLVITDASEGVEVFVNGKSCGIQIAPLNRYDLSKFAKPGLNDLVIEVATTLERQCYPLLDPMRKMMFPAPTAPTGLTGKVKLYYIEEHK